MRSNTLIAGLTLALLVPGAAMAQQASVSEEGLMAILETASRLGSSDVNELRSAAYAACAAFGANGEGTVGVFTQDGWSQSATDDGTILLAPPGLEDELYVLTSLDASFCAVISLDQPGGTGAAEAETLALLELTGIEVARDTDDDGCPMLALPPLEDGAEALVVSISSPDEGCAAADASSVIFMTLPGEDL